MTHKSLLLKIKPLNKDSVDSEQKINPEKGQHGQNMTKMAKKMENNSKF